MEHAAEFFRQLDRTFSISSDVTSKALTTEFDSLFLRKHLLASRFVVESLNLDAFDEEREWATERRRAADILARARLEKYGDLLAAFAAHLTDTAVAARTSRLYLRASEAFCAHAALDGSAPWRERQMIAHLKASPGQSANLARFVSYCRKSFGWDVRVPDAKLWKDSAKKTKRQIEELRKVLRATAAVADSALTTREVGRVLSLSLDIPAAQLLRERDAGRVVVYDNGAIKVTDQALLLPEEPLYRYARRWADLGMRLGRH